MWGKKKANDSESSSSVVCLDCSRTIKPGQGRYMRCSGCFDPAKIDEYKKAAGWS